MRSNPNQVASFIKTLVSLHFSFFPAGQDRQSWTVIRASLRSILKDDPAQPSVLLLVSGQAARPTARCLATRLACLVNKVLGKDSESLCIASEASEASASDLFGTLTSKLRSNTSSVALVGLEKTAGHDAMALHAFCDNENAPFKQAAIILTVEAEAVARGADPEAAAEEALREAWGADLDEDRIAPLLSRVVVSGVRVTPETGLKC